MKKIKIAVSEKFKQGATDFVGVAILAKVQNAGESEELWTEINDAIAEMASLPLEDIKTNQNIEATRRAYKSFGKDPNRYRPSAEALRRRIVRGLGLYKINVLVDLINLVSLASGYSIGGFDADKIVGEEVVLFVGEGNDVFEGIGRGFLNVEGLPLYRDEVGGIGTPTSDEERTKLTLETTTLLMLINGYAGDEQLQMWTDKSVNLLQKYCNAEILDVWSYS